MNNIKKNSCPDCDGRGMNIMLETQQNCCGNFTETNECCNDLISYQIPIIEGCKTCNSTGVFN